MYFMGKQVEQSVPMMVGSLFNRNCKAHWVFMALAFVSYVIFGFAPSAFALQDERPNVIFIAVDDLNHWVGHLGRNPQTKTPNIDRLAAKGTYFSNAHCAAPVCNPSRAALLSGKRPSTTGVYDNGIPYNSVIQSQDSVFTQFKKAGYETLAMGKLWHGGVGFADQWSRTGGAEKEKVAASLIEDRSIAGIKFGIVHAGDEGIVDTATADFGITELQKIHDRPFLLALGFHKPHMPWNVPKKYYDLHPLEKIELPPTKENDLDDVPAMGRDMALKLGDHEAVVKSGRWKEAIQAYLAAISYLDAQVGRVLDALEQSPHKSNTIVVLWGDHGWHLGEKQHWRKFALWEEATRAPLIWVAPGVTTAGTNCDRPIDFLTLYPTLCDLAKIPVPAHVEGKSIRSLLMDPKSKWEGIALTTFGKNNHAIRDDRYRYIRYADGSEELYDHQNDPYEWTNLATKAGFESIKSELAKHLPTTNVEPADKPIRNRAKQRSAVGSP
jgi:arylsulfatase A-like enzyme